MKQKLSLLLIGLTLMILLAACGVMAVEPGVVVLPTLAATASSATVVPATASATAAATAAATATEEAEATPTATAVITPNVSIPEATSIPVLNTATQTIIALTDVNMRSGPGTSYTIIGWVAGGQMAKVTGTSSDGNWWRVICPDDTIGSCWVTAGSQYTQPASDPGNQPATTAVPTTCTNAATFVADVTVPDNSQFTPNSGFIKTWRIKNSGTCTWTGQYSLVHTGGSLLGALTTSFPFPATVAPGQTIDLSVSLVAPATPGSYQGDWKLSNAQGTRFGLGRSGSAMWIKIVVPAPQPTANGSISGFVWQDKDADNSVDSNEMLPNITVALATGAECRTVLSNVKSDSSGRFAFNNLAASSYCLIGTDGSTTVSQSNIVLGQNQQLTNVIVNWPPVWPQQTIISGLIYQDTNQNGVYEAGEPILANREVQLVLSTACHVTGTPVAVTFSGADGRYTLAGQFNGSYCVGLKGSGGLDDVAGLTVTSGQSVNNLHLKAQMANGSISGWLWDDQCYPLPGSQAGNCVDDGSGSNRADGIIQPGEGYISGVTVRLQAGSCATDNPAILATAVTNNGRYTFTQLAAGTYCVFINANEGANSDKLFAGNWTYPQPGIWYQQLSLNNGQQLSSVNFGWDFPR